MGEDEVFTIKARLCKRCGRLLTSKMAIREGYGCACKRKAEIEKNGEPQIDGQISLFDEDTEE